MNGTSFRLRCLAVTLALLAPGAAFAAVDADQAARLDKDLTPVGAERAGNASGSIPAWDGGITTPPASFTPGKQHSDPFADETPVVTITSDNQRDHAEKLTPGQLAMFARYPTFRMLVYPTHRSAALSARHYEYTRKNATRCKLVADGEGVADCAEGLPFPIPQNAQEVIWNHKLRFRALTLQRWANLVNPSPAGAYQIVRIREQAMSLYHVPGNTSDSINNVVGYFFQETEGPARLAGNVVLVHESMDAAKQPRQAWVYNAGQRRVRRAPQVAYDNPTVNSDGGATYDMGDMFNGATDRFDWTLQGKKELYVPYNAYKAKANGVKVTDLVRPHHLNPDLLRYELHRVWVVDARLKSGQRHINSRRTFYLDEDSWQILAVEHYDGEGALWRYSEAPSIQYYEVPTFWSTLEVHHDLKNGRYLATLLDNEESPYDFHFELTAQDFSPQALRTRGIR